MSTTAQETYCGGKSKLNSNVDNRRHHRDCYGVKSGNFVLLYCFFCWFILCYSLLFSSIALAATEVTSITASPTIFSPDNHVYENQK